MNTSLPKKIVNIHLKWVGLMKNELLSDKDRKDIAKVAGIPEKQSNRPMGSDPLADQDFNQS